MFDNAALSLVSLKDLSGLGLGVGWGSSETVSLDGEVGAGLTHGKVEEAHIAPVCTPGIATNPVLLASGGVFAVADN